MTFRTYWCELTKKKTDILNRVTYKPVAQFNSAMDIDLGYTVQAAFLNGLRQYAGEYADPAEYRMNVYDAPGGVLRLPDFTAPADAGMHPGNGSLRGYADEHLISELIRRLQQR